MNQLYVQTPSAWRAWLSRHHDSETEIWLIFYKKETGRPSLAYEPAVEEALCYGWIDSIIKKIDAERYARKFTPRKDDSVWSELNKKRVAKLLQGKRMTPFGLAKIDAAKKGGKWDEVHKPADSFELPPEFEAALTQNSPARKNFEQLSPTYRKHYIGWIATAKRPETKARRIMEAISLLERGEKLGLK